MREKSFGKFVNALTNRIQAEWRLKLALILATNICFWTFYLFLSRHAFFPVHELPMTWLDNWVGFHPREWVWIYESAFLLSGMIPWLLTTREEVRRYMVGFALLAVVSFLIFALFPVASPRPINLRDYVAPLFFTRLDGTLNAFPSLHGGFLTYALAVTQRIFNRRPLFVMAALWIWAGLILYATLATKQHYALDLLAGGALGLIAQRVAWRSASSEAIAATNTCRNKEVASEAGCK
jgi:membrane-associated phospholipid phosphatase